MFGKIYQGITAAVVISIAFLFLVIMYITMAISGVSQVIAIFCKRRIMDLRRYLYASAQGEFKR